MKPNCNSLYFRKLKFSLNKITSCSANIGFILIELSDADSEGPNSSIKEIAPKIIHPIEKKTIEQLYAEYQK